MINLFYNYRGSREVLTKRLKSYTKKQHLTEHNVEESEKKYTDFYIVIDFEATCEEPNPPNFIHEIIEFPAVIIDADTLEIVSMY
jgi:Inhibitor of the KinA pathway to sporulation, predicted exonuclease